MDYLVDHFVVVGYSKSFYVWDSRCGHVSISLFGHSVQFGFGYVSG